MAASFRINSTLMHEAIQFNLQIEDESSIVLNEFTKAVDPCGNLGALFLDVRSYPLTGWF